MINVVDINFPNDHIRFLLKTKYTLFIEVQQIIKFFKKYLLRNHSGNMDRSKT